MPRRSQKSLCAWAEVALLATFASACASTGAVPKPFPMPGSNAAPAAEPARDGQPTPGAAGRFDSYALVGTALALRGTPYRNGGSDPAGFDCSGFTQYVFSRYGIALPREVREQYRVGDAVEPSQLAPGDLLFFATT